MNCLERISVLNWNIRGLNNQIARKKRSNLILKGNPGILLIQERKCSVIIEEYKESIWDGGHDWVTIEAQGLSGGLAISWDSRILTLLGKMVHHNWIWVRWTLNNVNSGVPQYANCINVYAPQNSATKIRLWMELNEILASHNQESFCIAGDFNCIRGDHEMKNCVYGKRDLEPFSKFINDNNLWDLEINNVEFIWYSRSGKCSRLDRVLLNENWALNGDWRVKGLARKSSDHVPLLLSYLKTDWSQNQSEFLINGSKLRNVEISC